MSDALPVVYLARHGETAWTMSHQHTGVTDLPLTAQGEAEAIRLGQRLEGLTFSAVLTSPLRRAARTCELAGFGSVAAIEPDLMEWELRRVRRSHQRRNPRRASRLAAVPRWRPRRRVTRSDRGPGRPRGAPGTGHRGEYLAVLERAFSPSLRRALARPAAGGGQVFGAEHGQPQRARVRARSFRSGDSPLGRDAA